MPTPWTDLPSRPSAHPIRSGRRTPAAVQAALLLSLTGIGLLPCGCAWLGGGTQVDEAGAGKYRVVTSELDDWAAENDQAAREACAGQYQVVQRGLQPDTAFNSLFRDGVYARFWIISCAPELSAPSQ